MVDVSELRERSVLAVVVMGYLTLFVYPIIWCRRTVLECNRATGRSLPGIGVTVAMVAVTVFFLASLVDLARGRTTTLQPAILALQVVYAMGVAWALSAARRTLQVAGVGGPSMGVHAALCLLLGFLWVPIAMGVTQARLNTVRVVPSNSEWTVVAPA